MINEEITNTEENIVRYKERISNFSKDFEIGLFIHLLSKIKWIIVLIFIITLFGSRMYLRYTPKKYETSSTIQLNINNQPEEFLNIYAFKQKTNLNSEVSLMKSHVIIDKALEKINTNISYYSQGEIVTRNLYRSSPFEIKNLILKDSSIYDCKLYLTYNGKYLQINNEEEDVLYAEYIQPNNYFSSNHFSGELILNQDTSLFKKELENYKFFFEINSINKLRNEISEGLEISILDYSANTINISFNHSNAKLAQDICNSIAHSYLEYDLNKKAISSVNIVDFISKQKDSVDVRLKNSEREIQEFKKINNVNSSEIVKNSNIEEISEFDKQLFQLKMEISMMEKFTEKFNTSLTTEINSSTMKSIALSKIFYDDKFILEMVKKLEEDVEKRDDLLRDITINNENIILLNNTIEEQIFFVKNALKMIKNQKLKKINQIEKNLKKIEIKLLTLPEKELELTRLERVHEINNKYFTLLLEKETEYELSKAGITTYNEILESASLSLTPIYPKPILVYSLSIIIGIILSSILALANYLLHDKITSLFEISKYSSGSISILGMIPMMKNKMPVSPLIIDKSPKSMITESFRAIRTNLQYINSHKESKMIAISSTVSGEGKTFLAINLAGIIAFTGKKVVIIDLDMRKPKIHRGFGVKNKIGMSDILVGKNNFNECINKSTLNGLEFITAGTIPPNPSELIVSDLFDKTILELKKHYDMIVVDNPPV